MNFVYYDRTNLVLDAVEPFAALLGRKLLVRHTEELEVFKVCIGFRVTTHLETVLGFQFWNVGALWNTLFLVTIHVVEELSNELVLVRKKQDLHAQVNTNAQQRQGLACARRCF